VLKTNAQRSRRRSRRAAPGSADTRSRLLRAAITTLGQRGFAGSTARAIAGAAGANQALIYYHFGDVAGLLLAALEATSRDRLSRYEHALAGVSRPAEMIAALGRLYREDVASGHVSAVQELVAGASSAPRLREHIVRHMQPWFSYAEQVLSRLVAGTPFENVLPLQELAVAAVALYLGIETLTQLEGNRSKADAVFDLGRRVAPLLGAS
jgi:AcrR family transcriptional regulator